MKIKLIRTGGFIPVTRMAEAEISITDSDLGILLKVIRADPHPPVIKDGSYYELTVGSTRIPVDLNKVPAKYQKLFVELKENLRIVKPGNAL
jgi:hypothetical protein